MAAKPRCRISGLGAMVPGPHRHTTVLVEDGCYVVGVYSRDVEADHPAPVYGVCRSLGSTGPALLPADPGRRRSACGRVPESGPFLSPTGNRPPLRARWLPRRVGVPASNFWGTGAQVDSNSCTSRIISPPPSIGSIFSRVPSGPHSTPIPVGPSILCPEKAGSRCPSPVRPPGSGGPSGLRLPTSPPPTSRGQSGDLADGGA